MKHRLKLKLKFPSFIQHLQVSFYQYILYDFYHYKFCKEKVIIIIIIFYPQFFKITQKILNLNGFVINSISFLEYGSESFESIEVGQEFKSEPLITQIIHDDSPGFSGK